MSPALRGIGSVVVAVAGCGRSSAPPAPPPVATADAAIATDALVRTAARPPCDRAARPLTPGVTLERHPLPPPAAAPGSEPCLDVVRVDLTRHRLGLVMASRDGAPRPIARWAEARAAVAAVNAGMFGDDHRGLGLLRDASYADRTSDNPRYGGWLVFDPIDPHLPAAQVIGRDCGGDLATALGRYRGAIQSYRLLGCDGQALTWGDDKAYSAAAFGVDRRGHLVLLHARAPYRMTDLAAALVATQLDLAGALYAEGGPEATLVAGPVSDRYVRVGSYETGFWEDDTNHSAWDVPNVLYAAPITSP